MDKIKKIIFIATGLFIVSAISFAQGEKSNAETMKATISLMDSAKTSADFIKAGEGFGSVTLHEKSDWLPAYYTGVCYALAAFEKKGKEIDVLCDKAEQYAAIADSLNRNQAEVLVLKSMIASARIGVSPATRGQKFGSRATGFINEALKGDPDNPRAYLMKAQGVLYTPAMFGGGAAKAKPLYEATVEKFKLYKSKGGLYPHWGKDIAEKQLIDINRKLKQ